MPISGDKLVAENITRFGGGFINHVNKTMKKVSKLLDKQVTFNMSLTDHTLKDLADMGHPYAKRHGSKGMNIHNPYWQVHIQSGRLISAKSSGVQDAGVKGGRLDAYAYVAIDPNDAPHAYAVIYGTSNMIPRDFMNQSLDQIRDQAGVIINDNLRDIIRRFK